MQAAPETAVSAPSLLKAAERCLTTSKYADDSRENLVVEVVLQPRGGRALLPLFCLTETGNFSAVLLKRLRHRTMTILYTNRQIVMVSIEKLISGRTGGGGQPPLHPDLPVPLAHGMYGTSMGTNGTGLQTRASGTRTVQL